MTADTVISIDAMGGDNGPGAVIAGLARAAKEDEALRFILHGDKETIEGLLRKRRQLAERSEIRHTDDVVPMDVKPSRAVRTGKQTSLWKALESVSSGEARVAFSAGNTGAIVAMATLILRRAPGVHRPAIAVHWPALTDRGFNVALDMGADVKADAQTLVQYAIMGSEYVRMALGVDPPRVGLLNVGSEDMKGRPELREARDLLNAFVEAHPNRMKFLGFVEGNDIPRDVADVIVTDGFTGNIAMKASEGTATMIRQALKDAFAHSPLSRIGGLFALTSLRRLRMRFDPRRVNGGVFLGLNGGVVKSHGAADALGHASALQLAAKMARDDFPSRVAAQLAKVEAAPLSAEGAETSDKAGPEKKEPTSGAAT